MDKKNDGIFRSMGYALCKCEIKEICVYFYGHPKRWTNHKYAHVWADLGRVAILHNGLNPPDGGIALFAATRASLGKQKAFVSKEKMGAFAPGRLECAVGENCHCFTAGGSCFYHLCLGTFKNHFDYLVFDVFTCGI